MRIPTNLSFWMCVLKNSDEVTDFLERGNQRQKRQMKQALSYCKNKYPEFFEDVNGKKLMKRMKQ